MSQTHLTLMNRFGYVPEGDEYDDDGAPHQNMVLTLELE